VPIGPYRGYWTTRGTRLAVRLAPRLWARISILEPLPDPEGTAVRFGGSFRRGGADIDVPVRFDWLPAGFAVAPEALAALGGAAHAWNVHWALAGRGSHVRVNATRGRPEDVRYPSEISRTPVQIGSRTGTWITYLGGGVQHRVLQLPLGDGVTLTLANREVRGDVPVPEAVVEQIAAGAIRLPADYSWMGP
jgi:hypothetical protein